MFSRQKVKVEKAFRLTAKSTSISFKNIKDSTQQLRLCFFKGFFGCYVRLCLYQPDPFISVSAEERRKLLHSVRCKGPCQRKEIKKNSRDKKISVKMERDLAMHSIRGIRCLKR